eukprot:TRINITY_DN4759_c0_g1_i6.p1 TRINITY_DN4759_c0_g1~~TRINITY_DN4759_c0_g1_i6.p1  ORF type:complete len:115 (+),score=31.11 TRINITY_DN4759_c0_g1_i6:242-586(+)
MQRGKETQLRQQLEEEHQQKIDESHWKSEDVKFRVIVDTVNPSIQPESSSSGRRKFGNFGAAKRAIGVMPSNEQAIGEKRTREEKEVEANEREESERKKRVKKLLDEGSSPGGD